ncbi:LacI family DNA-binding transcriptional regulator [Streptomyces aidingensis]|uniref:LacI family transcriptional regulator n=1 Tax=Streptomyces aidingensis TaxID=910347 RepID=A0A1I1V0U1_9ACTN|nr:LacI family DNA-binding transcriptional regulator [Streptomyces aidingensis]SFD76646.1 LacI family transcriptional regulator [Streptomyces aidingensis]
MGSVGMREVAALAGVSVSTVSNVLNRPERVSADAAARVRAAIEALGYVPNLPARQLRGGRSGTIGMAVMDTAVPFFSQMILAAETVAERSGLSLMVGNSFASLTRQERHLANFERYRVDGVLVTPVSRDLSSLHRLRRRGVPVVLVDARDDDGGFDSVWLDDVAGGRLATEHLIGIGRTRICFVGGPLHIRQTAGRLAGCREVMAATAGVTLTVRECEGRGGGMREGREAGEELAAMPAGERPDGIFAASDHKAIGLMQSLLRAGLRVPDDIAIVGYDDSEFAENTTVPLSSVRQPALDMGRSAAELLIQRISDADAPVRQVTFDPELIVRESTGARAAG